MELIGPKEPYKICSQCKKEYPLSDFHYQYSRGAYGVCCKHCKNRKALERTWRLRGFSSPEEGAEVLRKQTAKHNRFSAVYLIWLGEKNLYYVGSSEHFLSRRANWISSIKNVNPNYRVRDNTRIYLNKVLTKTNFYSIKILQKLPVDLSPEEIIKIEKDWIIKVILKHKNIYNNLT